jgi:hypothetical protein
MRYWESAPAMRTCGAQGCRIDEGDPVQVIQIGGLPKRYRCAKHAEGPIDWAEVEASKRSTPPTASAPSFVRVGEVRPRLPFDSKAAAAGERDE